MIKLSQKSTVLIHITIWLGCYLKNQTTDSNSAPFTNQRSSMGQPTESRLKYRMCDRATPKCSETPFSHKH